MQEHRLLSSWFVKYKIYHLVFWFVYHYVWWSISIGSPMQAATNIFFSPYTTKFLFYVVFQAFGVYFNLYYLIPKFLENSKYALYLSTLLATILITAGLITSGYYVCAFLSDQTFEQLFGSKPEDFLGIFKSKALSSTVASMTLAMSIKLTKNWIESNKKQQLLEKEKLETELKFLKSQFNPHFLFNTINSIFVLIHKNPDMASESLAKFSDLMRYQLYECNEIQISLFKEIGYLENFIELEKLRQDKSLQVQIDIENISHTDLTIAPFILMPFLENAFKHVSQGKEKSNWIKVTLKIVKKELLLEISNSVSTLNGKSKSVVDYGGIGLKNVKRRLDILYPRQYSLEIKNDKDAFKIQLKLELQTYINERKELTKTRQNEVLI